MQLVNGHEEEGGGVGGRRVGRAMVLDPIILPLPHFCFAPPGQREVGNLKRPGVGNYDFAYKRVEVIAIYAQ